MDLLARGLQPLRLQALRHTTSELSPNQACPQIRGFWEQGHDPPASVHGNVRGLDGLYWLGISQTGVTSSLHSSHSHNSAGVVRCCSGSGVRFAVRQAATQCQLAPVPPGIRRTLTLKHFLEGA